MCCPIPYWVGIYVLSISIFGSHLIVVNFYIWLSFMCCPFPNLVCIYVLSTSIFSCHLCNVNFHIWLSIWLTCHVNCFKLLKWLRLLQLFWLLNDIRMGSFWKFITTAPSRNSHYSLYDTVQRKALNLKTNFFYNLVTTHFSIL